jgi:hypothetical protein
MPTCQRLYFDKSSCQCSPISSYFLISEYKIQYETEIQKYGGSKFNILASNKLTIKKCKNIRSYFWTFSVKKYVFVIDFFTSKRSLKVPSRESFTFAIKI